MQLEGQTSVKGKYGSYQLLFLSLTLIFSLEKWVCHYDFSHKRKWAWFPLNKIINKDFKQVSSTKYIPSENTLACCSDSVLILQTWYLRVGKTRTKTETIWEKVKKTNAKCHTINLLSLYISGLLICSWLFQNFNNAPFIKTLILKSAQTPYSNKFKLRLPKTFSHHNSYDLHILIRKIYIYPTKEKQNKTMSFKSIPSIQVKN